MYSIYIPKYPNEKTPFKITEILNYYTSSITYDGLILSSPGYMSRTWKTIDEFIDSFKKNLNVSKKHWDFGLFNGMNGQSQISANLSIRTYHEQKLSKEGFNVINITSTFKEDHRKMLFFLQKTAPDSCYNTPFTLNKSNYNNFLRNFRVRAVMIGSTNQSRQSYYGGKKGKADKGEADLFLLIEDKDEREMITYYISQNMENATNYISSNGNNNDFFGNIIISQSIYMRKADDQYLKDILIDFLANSLS